MFSGGQRPQRDGAQCPAVTDTLAVSLRPKSRCALTTNAVWDPRKNKPLVLKSLSQSLLFAGPDRGQTAGPRTGRYTVGRKTGSRPQDA